MNGFTHVSEPRQEQFNCRRPGQESARQSQVHLRQHKPRHKQFGGVMSIKVRRDCEDTVKQEPDTS